MKNSHQRWLLEQLPQWECDGLLTADGARILRERHVVDTSQPGLAQIVMGSLGAMLIGTGLIAVIGYNWDDFSRPVRLLFAFLPLLLSQFFSFRVLQRLSDLQPRRRVAGLSVLVVPAQPAADLGAALTFGGDFLSHHHSDLERESNRARQALAG